MLELENSENKIFRSELEDGSVQCKKKLVALKPRRMTIDEMKSKFKPKIRVCVDYFCEAVTQGGAFKYIVFKSEERD
jgi:hypothetical protein